MLHYVMAHRTQLYLDESQYRWLKQRAGVHGSIAGVVRSLIDAARSSKPDLGADPLIRFLAEEEPAQGSAPSTVQTIDEQIYG